MSEKEKYWFMIEITDNDGALLLQIKTLFRKFALEIVEKFGTGVNFK